MKRQTEAIIRPFINIAKIKYMPVKVNLSFFWVEPNARRDHDNIAFAKKFILDALVASGVLGGDGQRYVGSFRDDFSVDKYRPGVVVTLTPDGVEDS